MKTVAEDTGSFASYIALSSIKVPSQGDQAQLSRELGCRIRNGSTANVLLA